MKGLLEIFIVSDISRALFFTNFYASNLKKRYRCSFHLHVPYGELKHSGSVTMSARSCFARSMKETARETFVALSSPTDSCTNARRKAESTISNIIHKARSSCTARCHQYFYRLHFTRRPRRTVAPRDYEPITHHRFDR